MRKLRSVVGREGGQRFHWLSAGGVTSCLPVHSVVSQWAFVAAWLGRQRAVQRTGGGGRPLAGNFLLLTAFNQTRTRTVVKSPYVQNGAFCSLFLNRKKDKLYCLLWSFFPSLASFPPKIDHSILQLFIPSLHGSQHLQTLTEYGITESTLGSDWLPQLPTIPWSWHPGCVHKQLTVSFLISSYKPLGPSFLFGVSWAISSPKSNLLCSS